MGPAPSGARRKRRRIPASRNVTSCTLSPQKLPITVRVRIAPRMYPIHPVEPFAENQHEEKQEAERHDQAEK